MDGTRRVKGGGVRGAGRLEHAGRRVLGCFPHPDDETYAAAGLLAWCARRGAEVHLLCATRGERGSDRRGRLAGAALAAVRSAELAASCAALGIVPPRFADLPDGGVGGVDRADAVARVDAHLQRLRPHLVVTLGPDGAYGHPDHLAWTAIVDAAVDALPVTRTPRLLHAVFPRRLFAPVAHLAQRAGVVADSVDPDALGIDRGDAHLRLDVRAAAACKLAAAAAHGSRLDSTPPSFFRHLLAPLLAEEWFRVARGVPLPAGANDPFAGL